MLAGFACRYDRFTFDITQALEKAPGSCHELLVEVTDPSGVFSSFFDSSSITATQKLDHTSSGVQLHSAHKAATQLGNVLTRQGAFNFSKNPDLM